MKIPRRKFVVTLHMRSGATHRIVCRRFEWKQSMANDLTSITAIGGQLPVYTRLGSIDMVTSRRAFLKWMLA